MDQAKAIIWPWLSYMYRIHPNPALEIFRSRCRANSAHIRQSKPESGLGFQVKVLETFSICSPLTRKRSCESGFDGGADCCSRCQLWVYPATETETTGSTRPSSEREREVGMLLARRVGLPASVNRMCKRCEVWVYPASRNPVFRSRNPASRNPASRNPVFGFRLQLGCQHWQLATLATGLPVFRSRCPTKSAHVRQSKPDSGLGFQVTVLKPFLTCSLFAGKRSCESGFDGGEDCSSRREAYALHPQLLLLYESRPIEKVDPTLLPVLDCSHHET